MQKEYLAFLLLSVCMTNKTADWLAEYTNDYNNNGFFVKYEFSRD
jgi:hypothetical protein